MKRDKTLDYLRGFAIAHVVFVHIFYWLDIFKTGNAMIVKSFFLFEMPIFFFTTGAVNSFSQNRSYRAFCAKRIKSILIPYYIYAAICVLISVAYDCLHGEASAKDTALTVLSWLIPLDHQIMPLPFFTSAVWFVPVFIFAILIYPVIKKAAFKHGPGTIIALAFLFIAAEIGRSWICSRVLDGNTSVFSIVSGTALDIVQKTAFYLIFMGLGVFYPKLKKRNRSMAIMACALLLVSICGLAACRSMLGCTLDMQVNKFPPNYIFLLYSVAILSAMYLIAPIVKKLFVHISIRFSGSEKTILFFSHNSIYVFYISPLLFGW